MLPEMSWQCHRTSYIDSNIGQPPNLLSFVFLTRPKLEKSHHASGIRADFRARNPGAEFSPASGASASDFLLSISKRKARGRQRAGGAHNHSKAYRRDCAACVISCDGVWYLTIEGFVVATVSCISNGETPRNGTPAPKMRPPGGLVFRPVFQR